MRVWYRDAVATPIILSPVVGILAGSSLGGVGAVIGGLAGLALIIYYVARLTDY